MSNNDESPPEDVEDNGINDGSTKLKKIDKDANNDEDVSLDEEFIQSLLIKNASRLNKRNYEILYKCPRCSEYIIKLANHMTQIHNASNSVSGEYVSKKYLCYFCLKLFGNLSTVKNHILRDPTHPTYRRKRTIAYDWTCDQCDEKLTKQKDYEKHFKEKHPGIKPHKCDLCGKRFYDRNSMIAHNDLAHSNKLDPTLVRRCKKCNLSFDDYKALLRHKSVVHKRIKKTTKSKAKFKCEECGKEYTSKYMRNLHVKRHKNQMEYVCHLCGHGNMTKQQHELHYARHNENGTYRKYICDICQTSFDNLKEFQRHKKEDHKDAVIDYNYICPECDQEFVKKYQYLQHLNAKHSLRSDMIKCKICVKNFTVSNVNQHIIATHTSFKPYMCNICGLRDKYQIYVRRHIASVHPDEPFNKKIVLYKPTKDLIQLIREMTEKVILYQRP